MNQIKAKIIAHSKSSVNGKEIITMELEYPRFIHAEILTHRMFSRNAASSRAIPVAKMIEQVRNDPAQPVHWGKNQSGMQAEEEVSGKEPYGGGDMKDLVKRRWCESAKLQANFAEELSDYGLHKQVVNRILEPFQTMKTVVTATEWENFYWLRNHEDAQPEIKRLAEVMLEAVSKSEAITLLPGEWHVPYYEGGFWMQGMGDSIEDALAISASCCAQVSYRLLDDSIEKARMVYKRLVESSPVHASPFEHQASPMEETKHSDFGYLNEVMNHTTWQKGITHVDRVNQHHWSGNFQGWIQHRHLIPNNVKRG